MTNYIEFKTYKEAQEKARGQSETNGYNPIMFLDLENAPNRYISIIYILKNGMGRWGFHERVKTTNEIQKHIYDDDYEIFAFKPVIISPLVFNNGDMVFWWQLFDNLPNLFYWSVIQDVAKKTESLTHLTTHILNEAKKQTMPRAEISFFAKHLNTNNLFLNKLKNGLEKICNQLLQY